MNRRSFLGFLAALPVAAPVAVAAVCARSRYAIGGFVAPPIKAARLANSYQIATDANGFVSGLSIRAPDQTPELIVTVDRFTVSNVQDVSAALHIDSTGRLAVRHWIDPIC